MTHRARSDRWRTQLLPSWPQPGRLVPPHVRTAYGYGPVDLDFLNGGRGFGPGGEGLGLENVYGLGVEDGRRVRGGPDWVRREHYTIEAVAGRPADAATMRGPMLRPLIQKR